LVSAKGALNAVGHHAVAAPSTISNSASTPAFGSPANEHYRGLATVKVGLEKLTTGKGLKPGQKPARGRSWPKPMARTTWLH
jgi:hypothetical protein